MFALLLLLLLSSRCCQDFHGRGKCDSIVCLQVRLRVSCSEKASVHAVLPSKWIDSVDSLVPSRCTGKS